MARGNVLAGLLIAASAMAAIGMAGAWAFNPDDGAVGHSDLAWRICGIAVYLGAATVVLSAVALVVAFALGGWRRTRSVFNR